MPLPPAMLERARQFTGPPAPARPAATVVLLRPSGPAFDVYVLRRATTMVFGGVYAFPGGAVDPTDRPSTIRSDWANRLGVPEEQAHAVVGAAARELFEETGVLLAGPIDEPDRTVTPAAAVTRDDVNDLPGDDVDDLPGDDVDDPAGDDVDDPADDGWEADRAAVQRRELTMTDLLARRGLRLRDDLLLPWSRWITPEFEPRRFDTWFFVALLPESQNTRDVSGEADETAWVSPAETADLPMLPPTRHTLNQLAAHSTIADVVAASAHRDAANPVQPRLTVNPEGQARFELP
ncbi:NUDIX domain-containing protein [Actinoplanes sp. NPDC023714]|uniref:NUDIX hydrolase n=1 Tax=Actinoplanes sp. NPDC023714 TaxID=3154322 RepID=UPI003404AF34